MLYAGSCVVFTVSVAAAWLLPVPGLFKGLASIPGVGALVGILVQLWREQRAHERALELLHRQQDFALATASHMANIAYDRHVAFCEAYIKRTNEGVQELMRLGPTKAALVFCSDLMKLRMEYTAWLTPEIEARLIPLETALKTIGGKEILLESLRPGDRRSRIVDEIHQAFGMIVGVEKPATDEDRSMAAAKILDHVRDVVGINELTALRQTTTRVALRRVSKLDETQQ